MRRAAIGASSAITLAVLFANVAGATPAATTYTARLTAGQMVRPLAVPAPNSHGLMKLKFNPTTHDSVVMVVSMTLSSKATKITFGAGAKGTPGQNFTRAVCARGSQVPCSTQIYRGEIIVPRSTETLAAQGRLYVVAMTAKNPRGEVRGQLLAG